MSVDFSCFLDALRLEAERFSVYLEFKERFAERTNQWAYEGTIGPCDEPTRFVYAPVTKRIEPTKFKHRGSKR